MGSDTSTWLSVQAPVSTTNRGSWSSSSPSSSKRQLLLCKPTIFCCINGSTHSPLSSSSVTRSYSRRWYNPLRQRPFNHPPQIIRHWTDADLPAAFHERFTVASYNILGDKNAAKHKDMYSNVSSSFMKWDHRKRVICDELIGWNPDVICLQEVDKYFDLLNIMKKAGYAGSYKRRTGDAVDGCAMFWKADKFRLLEEESIEFKGFGLRDNVAQLSVFEMCSAESRRLVIGNIHVLYNPNRGDVKLGQIRFLSSRAHLLSKKWGGVPVVLAGDFNITPQSAIYKFLSTSELDIMSYDRRELSGQRSCHPVHVFGLKRDTRSPFILMDRFLNCGWTGEEVKVATGRTKCESVVHPLKLNSSYAAVKGSTRTRESNGEPLATSYHSKFLGTVDYLWYSDGIVPTRVLDTLPIDILRRTGGLPCKEVGSDHLALVAEFAFTQGKEEGDDQSKSMAISIV